MANDVSKYALYSNNAEEKRAIAVAAALAIIEAKVANSPSYNGIVADELKKLESYADQIEAALKTK